jgi:hypothetical protein
MITTNIPPKKLFLIDSLGALLTALLVGVMIANLEHIFGMPQAIAHGLGLIAFLFAIYSFMCFLLINVNWRPFLRGIAFANLSYCIITAGLVVYLFQELTNLGIIYFLSEKVVVIVLVSIELKQSNSNPE